MTSRAIVLALALAGCVHDDLVSCDDNLCPADTTCINGACVSGDLETEPVTLTVERANITTQVTRAIVAPETAQAFIPDPTSALFESFPLGVTVDGSAAGEANVHRIVGLPDPVTQSVIVYTLPGETITHAVAAGTLDVHLAPVQLGPADAELAPVDSQLDLAPVTFDPLPAGGLHLRLSDIGAWWFYDFVGDDGPAPAMSTWDPAPIAYAQTISQLPIPVRTRTSDLLYLSTFAVAPRETVLFDLFSLEPLDQSEGVQSVPTPTPEPVPLASLDFAIDTSEVQRRLPATGSLPVVQWQVLASPGAEIGVASGLSLGFGSFADQSGPRGVTVPYGSPASIPWPRVAVVTSANTLPTNRPWVNRLALLAGATLVDDPDRDATLDLSGPLPILTEIAGTPLIIEDAEVTADLTRGVTLRAFVDRGACDHFRFSFSLVDDLRHLRTTTLVVDSATAAVTIPGSLLKADATYLLQTACVVQSPGSLPLRQGLADSVPFIVRQAR